MGIIRAIRTFKKLIINSSKALERIAIELRRNVSFNALAQAEIDRQDESLDEYTGQDGLLVSCPCSYAQLKSPLFDEWRKKLLYPKDNVTRKLWEWIFISQALKERGMLAPGKRGLGFAVGREPLADMFASFGCEVTASDLGEAEPSDWAKTGQHADRMEDIMTGYYCSNEEFAQRVSFRAVDMNDIPSDLTDYDFIWSSCALEHLGSIKNGENYIYNAMKCLKPGGVAVHTTELNVSSNSRTVKEHPNAVIFRQKDLERIRDNLISRGDSINLCFKMGETAADGFVLDNPSEMEIYFTSYDMRRMIPNVHLRQTLDRYIITSYGFIIEKSPDSGNLRC